MSEWERDRKKEMKSGSREKWTETWGQTQVPKPRPVTVPLLPVLVRCGDGTFASGDGTFATFFARLLSFAIVTFSHTYHII